MRDRSFKYVRIFRFLFEIYDSCLFFLLLQTLIVFIQEVCIHNPVDHNLFERQFFIFIYFYILFCGKLIDNIMIIIFYIFSRLMFLILEAADDKLLIALLVNKFPLLYLFVILYILDGQPVVHLLVF